MEPSEETSVPNRPRIQTCQHCGLGFMLTATYDEFLSRCGIKVTVAVQCPSCFWRAGPLPKQEGKIKWFSQRKHCGFIITDQGRELFFHQRQLVATDENQPREGQSVRYHLQESITKAEALNIELCAE